MIRAFCPIAREDCRMQGCMAWKDEKCLIFSFLEAASGSTTYVADYEDDEEEQILRFERPSREVPPRIRDATPEELAAELVAFAKREFAEEDRVWISQVARFFWEEQGVAKWELPADIQFKLEKAERIAQQQIDKEKEARLREQIEKEKAELPYLVSRCVAWAKKQGLTRLTQADIDAFLLEENIEIQPQTKRALYATANVQMKSVGRR